MVTHADSNFSPTATVGSCIASTRQQPQIVPLYERSPGRKDEVTVQANSVVTPSVIKVREIKSEKMVDAWDKIGVLTMEMTKSIIAKESALVAKRYRTGNTSVPLKKPRLDNVSDEKKGDDERQGAVSPCQDASEENWSESLSRRVDRMARMSKLIMEIEYCHRLLRQEMVAIQNDLSS